MHVILLELHLLKKIFSLSSPSAKGPAAKSNHFIRSTAGSSFFPSDKQALPSLPLLSSCFLSIPVIPLDFLLKNFSSCYPRRSPFRNPKVRPLPLSLFPFDVHLPSSPSSSLPLSLFFSHALWISTSSIGPFLFLYRSLSLNSFANRLSSPPLRPLPPFPVSRAARPPSSLTADNLGNPSSTYSLREHPKRRSVQASPTL